MNDKTMLDKPLALSVKAIVLDGAGRCLAIRRSSASKNNAGMWDFPGGKCDPGEDLRTALLREIREETGLDVQPTRVAGTARSELPDRIVVYLLFEVETARLDVRLSEEHDDYRWQPRSDLARLSWSAQFVDFIERYAAERK